MNRTWIVTGTLVILLAGCGGDDSSSPVLPFAEVQASEIVIEFSPSATSGVLMVETTIDMVCAVAYGTTEQLGSLSTDDDMAGGAHDDHSPAIPGLQPETTYFYRLQGVGIDGELYRSELMTFTTPPAAETSDTNAALGATVTDVSSEFSAAFAAANAIDGDPSTEWSSRGDGDEGFIEIDLGSSTDVIGLEFITRSMGDGSSITADYLVIVDGARSLGPFPADERIDVEFAGRVLRFEINSSTGGNTGAVDIAVYAGA